MLKSGSIPWIPLGSFALAALLSILTGPSSRAQGRVAGSTTACAHTFIAKIPTPTCVESETNGVLDAPANCNNVTPPNGTRWYSQIEGADAQYLVSVVADGAANNGGLLAAVPPASIDASKTLTGTMPCDPCHNISAAALGTATVAARMGHAHLPFDFTVASAISVVTVSRSSDCNGPNDTKTSFAYVLVARFVMPALPPGERTTGFFLTGSPGLIRPRQLRPVGNNPDQFATTSTADLNPAFGGIAQNAKVTFHSDAQILGLKAALTNIAADANTGAQAAGRLGTLSLVDTTEPVGD